MSHKKAGGSTRLGRDSKPQYLGAKVGDGEYVKPGMILVRQRGTRINPGKNVRRAKDDSLFSVANGIVKFTQKRKMHFDGALKPAKFVSVIPKK